MLHYSLYLKQVVLAGHPTDWPQTLDLDSGLQEFLLIEEEGLQGSKSLLKTAATLEAPVQGQIWHWGKETATLCRAELYDLRRKIAYISPRQVLLHRLTLRENLALGPCYHLSCSVSEALRDHTELLISLDLVPYLSLFPPELPEAVYVRALWARELIKGPELILALLDDLPEPQKTQNMIFNLLRDYQHQQGGALMLAGPSLEPFYPLAHRLLRPQAGQLIEHRFLEHQLRPLTAFISFI